MASNKAVNVSADGSTTTVQNRMNDDAYLAQIAEYKENPYYEYLLRNPFMFSKQADFVPTFWQSIGEDWFGDYSARNQYYGSILSNQNQWLSEALERFRQEEYNSPAEQVARQRAAGLNPDLNGSVDSGAAAENDQPIQPVNWPSGSDSSGFIEGIGRMSMNFVSQVMGLAQSFQGLKLGSQELVSREIANNESARDFVLDQIAGTSFFNSENDLDNISSGDLANSILAASSKVDYSVYSPATRKLMKRMFNRYAKDVSSGRSPMAVEDLKSALRSKIVANNKSAVEGASSPLFDEDFNTWLRNVAEIFGKYEYRAQVSEYNSRISKADYDTKYFHTLDPELQAGAENHFASKRSTESEQFILTEQMWNDIYKVCVNSDTWYGTLGLILIPYLRSTLSNFNLLGILK